MSLQLRDWKTLSNELSGYNDTSKVEAGSSRTGAEVRFLCCRSAALVNVKKLNLT